MVSVLIGNLLESKAQTLVNTVNCVGVMGKGVALEFKKCFPDMYTDYVARCNNHEVRLGEPYLYRRLLPPNILNFPTKLHWRAVSRLSDIVRGLEYLEGHYQEWGITSLAIPPLGCGQGQLEWRVVGPTLYRYLSRLDIPIELYAPFGTPQLELSESFLRTAEDNKVAQTQLDKAPKITPAWVALVEIVARIEREPYHWPVGRTIFQKIAYFATEFGLPTGLTFNRGSYGPFSSEVKPLITRLVNNGLVQEEPLGSMFALKLGSTYQDAIKAFPIELHRWEPIIEKVADLFLRTNTKQAEIAATVYSAARSLEGTLPDKPSEMDVLEEVKKWKERRRPPLEDADIAHAIRGLNMLHLLDVRASTDLPVWEEVTA